MKNTLTREELIKARNAFSCKNWTNPIQEILDSTNNENIEIEDKYLDLIKEHTYWDQILFCKGLNLDLKMNLPIEAKEWILEKIKACEILKYNEFRTLYQENGKTLFVLDLKYKAFWFEYDEIFEFLKEKHLLKYNEMRELLNSILKEHFKLEGYTPLRINTSYIGRTFQN